MIDGKKVCWMYRKGRCRQGAQCKFAHDNDVKTNRLIQEVKYDADSQISSEKCHHGAVEQIKLNPVHSAEVIVLLVVELDRFRFSCEFCMPIAASTRTLIECRANSDKDFPLL